MKTYIAHLQALKEIVKADNIPDEAKADILRVIMRLETLLLPYTG